MNFRALFASVILLATPLRAQEFRSNLSGRVTDASGAAIPGAKVELVESATSARSTVNSGAEGDYVLPFLSPGAYVLTVEA